MRRGQLLQVPSGRQEPVAGIARIGTHPYHVCAVDPPYLDEPEHLSCAPVAFNDALARAPDRLLDMVLATLDELFADAKLSRIALRRAGGPLHGEALLLAPREQDLAPREDHLPPARRRRRHPPLHPHLPQPHPRS